MLHRKGAILDRAVNGLANGVAAGGLTSPAWWPYLETASGVAVHLVPILSALFLAVQIYSHLRKGRKA